ncbi:MAG: hypothetical protein V3S31_00625 [Dehalococcoidia bacterium]
MSIRQETVYWHGCADDSCASDSHGCARVEIWIEGSGDGGLGYIYDGGIHCPACAEQRQETAERPLAGLLVAGDEWWDTTMPGCQRLECSTCSKLIDESHDGRACGCTEDAPMIAGGELASEAPLALSA